MKELKIRQVKGYTVPVYPKGVYRKPDSDMLRKMALAGSASAFLLILAGCEELQGGGTVGPPPVDPDLPTEAQAKEVITATFALNGIPMEENRELALHFSDGDSIRVNLDGWNDSLRVGYEYEGSYFGDPAPDTLDLFLYSHLDVIDSLRGSEGGPYIGYMYPTTSLGIEENLEYLRSVTQEMVDSLRAQGHI